MSLDIVSLYFVLQAADLVSETMTRALQYHRERLAAEAVLGNDEGGLVLPHGKGGKVVGFIYRLVEPEVRL